MTFWIILSFQHSAAAACSGSQQQLQHAAARSMQQRWHEPAPEQRSLRSILPPD
eukprot:SAG22_NODE_653_length_8139_cov_13.407711_6_plen_54_part_00